MIKKPQIDLGLALLSMRAKRGVPLSHIDIAAWCDCSKAAIRAIEQSALKKVKLRLGVVLAEIKDCKR